MNIYDFDYENLTINMNPNPFRLFGNFKLHGLKFLNDLCSDSALLADSDVEHETFRAVSIVTFIKDDLYSFKISEIPEDVKTLVFFFNDGKASFNIVLYADEADKWRLSLSDISPDDIPDKIMYICGATSNAILRMDDISSSAGNENTTEEIRESENLNRDVEEDPTVEEAFAETQPAKEIVPGVNEDSAEHLSENTQPRDEDENPGCSNAGCGNCAYCQLGMEQGYGLDAPREGEED